MWGWGTMGEGESKAYNSRPGSYRGASFFGVAGGSQRRYRLIVLIALSGPTALLLPELPKTLQLLLLPTAGCCQQPRRLFCVPYFFGFEDQYAAGPSRRREIWFYSSTHPSFYRHLPLPSPLTPLAPTHPSIHFQPLSTYLHLRINWPQTPPFSFC